MVLPFFMGLIIGVRYVPVARIPLYAGEKQFLAVQVANFVGTAHFLTYITVYIAPDFSIDIICICCNKEDFFLKSSCATGDVIPISIIVCC